MSRKTKKICVCDTSYTLFLYFLLNKYNPEDIFVFSKGINPKIRKRIPHFYFPIQYISPKLFKEKPNIFNFIKRYFLYAFYILKLRLFLFFKTYNCNKEVYGQGHLTFSFPLYETENNFLVEDGLGNYVHLEKPSTNHKLLKKFFGFWGFYSFKEDYGFGTHPKIKNIYLTKKEVPEIIKDKVKYLDVKALWNDLSDNEKTQILNLFDIDLSVIDSINEDTVIFLTQPLSEDKFISFDEELKIYKDFLSQFSKENIIIKTHPREGKNYRKIFPDIKLIDEPFPIEILTLIGGKINKLATVCSSAALNIENCEIIIYNGEISSKSLENARKILKEELNKL